MNPPAPASPIQTGIIDIRDLLDECQSEQLSDYLILSIRSDGQDTTISFTTPHTHPETYAAVLPGVAASSLQALLLESSLISPLDQLS
jgi:hypothetical protein